MELWIKLTHFLVSTHTRVFFAAGLETGYINFFHARTINGTFCHAIFRPFFRSVEFFSRPAALRKKQIFLRKSSQYIWKPRKHMKTHSRAFSFIHKFFLLCASSFCNVSWRIKRSTCTTKWACLQGVLIIQFCITPATNATVRRYRSTPSADERGSTTRCSCKKEPSSSGLGVSGTCTCGSDWLEIRSETFTPRHAASAALPPWKAVRCRLTQNNCAGELFPSVETLWLSWASINSINLLFILGK